MISIATWIARLRAELNERASLWTSWPWHTTAAQRLGLLRMIAVAAEQQLPLTPLLEAWTADERGTQHFRLMRLLRLLKQGTPLASAVEQIPGLLRDDDVLAIRFGAQSGALAPAVRARIEQLESTPAGNVHPIRKTLIYCGIVALFGSLIVVFVRIKIIPAFVKIFHDFSTEQPEILQYSIRLDQAFANYSWLGLLIVLVVLWAMFSAWPGRFFRNSILGRFFRPVRELRAADVLQKLAVAVQAGRPISGVLSTLARYHFDPVVRQKLLYVRNEVEQGADVWQSMSTAGLLSAPERRALDAAEKLGNRTWTLEQLALTKRRRTMRRMERWAELLLPALVICMGVLVLIQTLSIMTPLANLILGLT